jgi:hypothetical protein
METAEWGRGVLPWREWGRWVLPWRQYNGGEGCYRGDKTVGERDVTMDKKYFEKLKEKCWKKN